jgi:hypothetical protein
MFRRKVKAKAEPQEKRTPQPCQDCGSPGVYGIDVFGVSSEKWRCRDCHERACRMTIREDTFTRYGYS